MNQKPASPPPDLACFGLCCPQPRHANCARYQAVETDAAAPRIATCSSGAGQWPLYKAQPLQQHPRAPL